MEKGRVQSGLQSSSVKAMNHISWIVTPLAQLESPAHLAMLLDSPAQVKISLSCQHCHVILFSKLGFLSGASPLH